MSPRSLPPAILASTVALAVVGVVVIAAGVTALLIDERLDRQNQE